MSNRKILPTLLVIMISFLIFSFWKAYQPQPVRLQGQIEARQYNISSKIPGRIDKMLVRKGDQIKQGQLVYTLLSPELDAKLEQAKAVSEAEEALASEAKKGARKQQLETAKDNWLKAGVAVKLAEKTFQRIDNLYKDDVLSEQKRDEAYSKLQASRYTEKSAKEMFQMTQEGTREERQKAASAKARVAKEKITEVEAYTAESKVESWHDGEVSQVLLQTGEIAPKGFPVVSIIDMQDAWAIFHVTEDLLKDYLQGTEISVVIPALGQQLYRFKVSHVSVMGDFATWRATDASQGFDMRTFEVEARPLQDIDNIRVGMSILIRTE
ncbi:MAG: biotin/lipoyl-binding protein [Gammaproteobacteria bacterium]|nr:biotin/lipoyl-binding protein [Gammaproteobacteria bacterium]